MHPLRWLPIPSLILALMLTGTVTAQTGMSPRLHTEVQQISEMMDAGNDRQAADRLQVLSRRGDLNRYEKAVLNQMLGYASFALNEYDKAMEAFETALSFDTLPEEVAAGIIMALTQVSLELRDYEAARRYVEQALETSRQPDPDYLAVAAYVYYELEAYELTVRYALKAIESGEDPRENWYQVLLAGYRALESWDEAEAALREMLTLFPGQADYWLYLGYVLFEQGKEHEALSAMMLAYRLDMIEGDDLERIAGFHANLGIPEKAARLLEEWLETGRLESTAERQALAGRLWLTARERDQAKRMLTRAAEETPDGETDLLLAKLHYEAEDWQLAVRYFQRALDKGDLRSPVAEAQLLLGISAYHANQTDTAERALQAAGREPKYQDHARFWLTRIQEGG